MENLPILRARRSRAVKRTAIVRSAMRRAVRAWPRERRPSFPADLRKVASSSASSAGRSTPVTAPSRTISRPATNSCLTCSCRAFASSSSIAGTSGSISSADKLVPVQHQQVGRRACRDTSAVALAGHGETAVLARDTQQIVTPHLDFETRRPCGRRRAAAFRARRPRPRRRTARRDPWRGGSHAAASRQPAPVRS